MGIRYSKWIYPDMIELHAQVEAALEQWFSERFADYPHISLPGLDPYDYDGWFNRLAPELMARGSDYCEREWHGYVPSPQQLNQAFFRAVSRSNKCVLEPDRKHGDPDQS
ncbi:MULTISPECIES: hypothetical protein [Cobetia]|uniref:hypothetical protein n=1 Tax=Cobetia TaxID=204286 RepID=UPI001583B8A3|nr:MULTISPECIES: hypothetical protein [Cobetia]MDI4662572.1 hypothetical protein [Cobetia sp. BMC6]NUJ57883.1 hypothetical protein [Cobetia marina]